MTNVVKCRPPSNRRPESAERRACRKYLDRELERVQPRFILLMGGTALTLVNERGVERNRGSEFDFAGAKARVTFHPSARLPEEQAKFREDMAEFVGWVQEYRDAQVAGTVESFAAVCNHQQNCGRPTRYVLRLSLSLPERPWWRSPILAVCVEHVASYRANGWRRILGPVFRPWESDLAAAIAQVPPQVRTAMAASIPENPDGLDEYMARWESDLHSRQVIDSLRKLNAASYPPQPMVQIHSLRELLGTPAA